MDPMQFLVAQSTQMNGPFAPNSRYRNLPIVNQTLSDGRVVRCLTRRFLPQPEEMTPTYQHQLQPNERLDHVAHRYFSDPESFWQICDANRSMRPCDLTDISVKDGKPRVLVIASSDAPLTTNQTN